MFWIYSLIYSIWKKKKKQKKLRTDRYMNQNDGSQIRKVSIIRDYHPAALRCQQINATLAKYNFSRYWPTGDATVKYHAIYHFRCYCCNAMRAIDHNTKRKTYCNKEKNQYLKADKWNELVMTSYWIEREMRFMVMFFVWTTRVKILHLVGLRHRVCTLFFSPLTLHNKRTAICAVFLYSSSDK